MARALLAVVAIVFGLLLADAGQAAVPSLAQPKWIELSTEQQRVLAPLSGEWDKLEPWRRKKWVDIAKRYPSMKPEEQQRVQRRMRDWATLTPQQRKAVREQYKDMKKAPPEQKAVIKQKWQEYKDLPEDEKKRLKAQAAAKPAAKTGVAKPLTSTLAPQSAVASTPPTPTAPAAQ